MHPTHPHLRGLRALARRAVLLPMVAGGALAAGVAGLPMAAGAAPAATGTVITTAATAFGRALVVGSGPIAGYSLYFLTSDHGSTFGCTAGTVTTPIGPLTCTGASGDHNAEWPAITTRGAPVAAGGVSSRLLGTVGRTGIGEQVTYAGHPLYLFDGGPGQVSGEGWDEPTLPPWHGIWDLIGSNGKAVPWPGTLTTMRIGARTVLATPMVTGAGWADFPVYSYSRDTAARSACTGACARAWPPMLTNGRPGVSVGVSAARVGVLSRASGAQVRYRGKPLYLFAFEGLTSDPAGGTHGTGTGTGARVRGGTFELVSP